MPEKTEQKQKVDKRKTMPHLFKPGESGNPKGRPKGTQNFATKWRKFIEKVAEETGKTPEEIDKEMYTVALEKAMSGDYQFYRDIQDRVFGKPVSKNEVSGPDGGPIEMKKMEEMSDEELNEIINI